jgi:outer membrane protein TolC
MATMPPLVTEVRVSSHRLAVLLGQRPGELDAALVEVPRPFRVAAISIGAPEELLRRRPDVRSAERALAARTARVGVATADLFPRVSVSGFFGFISGSAGTLGNSDSRAWSVAPSITWPAFDLGSTRAILEANKAQADE